MASEPHESASMPPPIMSPAANPFEQDAETVRQCRDRHPSSMNRKASNVVGGTRSVGSWRIAASQDVHILARCHEFHAIGTFFIVDSPRISVARFLCRTFGHLPEPYVLGLRMLRQMCKMSIRSYGLLCPVTLSTDPQRHLNHGAPNVGITLRGQWRPRTRKE